MIKTLILGTCLSLSVGGTAAAKNHHRQLKVQMNNIDATGVGKPAGTVTIKEVADGLELKVNLKGLPAGEHGFHVHESGNCGPADKDGKPAAGVAAGGHYDPEATKAHKGPAGGGHKGDLPKLEVDAKGVSTGTFKVAGITLADVEGRGLMIHAAGDNYSDMPAALGGGGPRIVCGVVPTLPAAKAEATAKP